MTTEQRERAFLNYLSALEDGNLDEIEAFLKLAETDEILEQMMTEYHEQDTLDIEIKPKIITPKKYKRGQSPVWMRRVAGGLVATVMMALVGLIGVYIGLNANSTPPLPVADEINYIPEMATGECYGIVTDNVLTMVGNDLSVSNREIGINEPFIVDAIAPYMSATISNYPVTVRGENVVFSDNCDRDENITVYPQGYRGETCDVTFNTLALAGLMTESREYQGAPILYDFGQPLLIWSTRTDTVEVISRTNDGDFRAFVPESALTTTGNCDNEPLLYQPNVNSEGEICDASLVYNLGTITLESAYNTVEDMTVAFNNPLAVIVPEEPRSARYGIVYQGFITTIDSDRVIFGDACEAGQVVRIYPDDNPRQQCDVVLNRVEFPMRDLTLTNAMFRSATLGYEVMTLTDIGDERYYVNSANFTGTINAADVTLVGDCDATDLLYVPPSNLDALFWDNLAQPDYVDNDYTLYNDRQISLETLTVIEQQFENGVMFYLPAVEQIWIAYTDADGVNHWRVHSARPTSPDVTIHTIDGYEPVDPIFMDAWLRITGADDRTLIRYVIGSAVEDAITHTIDYGALSQDVMTYQLRGHAGQIYTFDSVAWSWEIE